MEYIESPPSPVFSGFIKRFWSLEYDPAGKNAESETVLPDGCPEIVFNLSDRFLKLHRDGNEVQAATLFSGQLSRNITIQPTGRVQLFGVRFQPAGFVPFGVSMGDMTDQIVDLRLVLGQAGGELEEMVNSASGFTDRIRIFENHFRSRLADQGKEDPLTSAAAEMITQSGGAIPLSALRGRLGVSERRLERHFKGAVGISPKMLARISRFQAVVRTIQRSESVGLLDAALSFGYFDQSHMIREFREFSGETPRGYFDHTHKISDIFTSVVD
ncbi:MAG: AraC family transcriptional regulator [Acidobacteria bacterium]|nr:AraC family transcriptional regulator [Acidobacteriota bacterium]